MRASEFDYLEYDALLKESKQRSWLWFGLIVSLGLHLALCTYFYRTRFQSVDAALAGMQQTPTFKIKNVDLGQQLEKSSLDQASPAAKPGLIRPMCNCRMKRNHSTNFCRTSRPARRCRTTRAMSCPSNRKWNNRT